MPRRLASRMTVCTSNELYMHNSDDGTTMPHIRPIFWKLFRLVRERLLVCHVPMQYIQLVFRDMTSKFCNIKRHGQGSDETYPSYMSPR